MFKKKCVMIPVCVLVMMFGLTACSEETEEKAVVQQVVVSDSNPLVAEQTVTIGYGDVIKRELYDGVVTPYTEELSFAQDGTFLEYKVAIGDVVEEGQIIACTDNSGIKERVENLEEQITSLTERYEYNLATLKNKEEIIKTEMDINYLYLDMQEANTPRFTQLCQALGRQEKSLKSNQLEQKHLTEEYELELPYLQEQLKKLKKEVDENNIVAPFSGTIVQLRSVAGGDRVNAGNVYVAIADTNRYVVTADYARSAVVEKAQRVYMFINGREYDATYLPMDKELYSKVLASGGKAYSEYEIFPENGIKFGQAAKAVIVTETSRDVLVVPYFAVQVESSRRYCYVKRGDEREKVFIDTGLFDGMYYEVKNGLVEGDEVFIE
ncbi:MAG: hypothetical protein IJX63_11680 [Lachnospiraceae bacterium]|nr:hypothetical protein [Lachnospiraceae bacterium]